MINLLPQDEKRQIIAGQTNRLLARYCIISLALAALLFIYIGISYFILMKSKSDAEQTIAESNRQLSQYQEVQQQAKQFSDNLKIAKSILDKEVPYSKIAVKIAQALPKNIVLQSLDLDATTFGKPVSLTTKGKSYSDALELKTALENKKDFFQNVHLVSVTANEAKDGYPMSIVISVVIRPEVIKS
jgi:hypothetical protein